MAKRRGKKRSGSRRKKIPLAATAGVASALLPIAGMAMTGNLQEAGNALASRFTGFDPGSGTFSIANLALGLLPIVLGATVSMAVSKAGLNRYLSGIPFIKI